MCAERKSRICAICAVFFVTISIWSVFYLVYSLIILNEFEYTRRSVLLLHRSAHLGSILLKVKTWPVRQAAFRPVKGKQLFFNGRCLMFQEFKIKKKSLIRFAKEFLFLNILKICQFPQSYWIAPVCQMINMWKRHNVFLLTDGQQLVLWKQVNCLLRFCLGLKIEQLRTDTSAAILFCLAQGKFVLQFSFLFLKFCWFFYLLVTLRNKKN